MKADPKAAEAAPKSKKMMMIIIVAVLALGLGGGGAWFFLKGKPESGQKEVKKAEKPEFVVIEPFTVNLQPEEGEQYLQIQFTLQVANVEQVEIIKTNMPHVRNRVLLLLSGKKASEINTVDGKKLLSKEIIESIKQPFFDKGPSQEVSDVMFTSFIIQ